MRYLVLALPIALTACGRGSTVTAENASMAEVGARVKASGAAIQLTPGRWETAVTIDRMDIPGMPSAVAAQMKQQLSKAAHGASCLTPEQARKPAADFFSGKHGDECRYDRFTMRGGAIDATMTCGRAGPKVAATLKGTYGPDNFHMSIAMDGKGRSSMPTMAMTVDARHAGACRGDETRR